MLLDGGNPHPLREKGILADYAITTMMFPMMTVGSALSSFITPAVPDIYITIGYAIIVFGILIFSLFRLTAMI